MKRSVKGKRVIVGGMGKSGVAASVLLKKMGAEVKTSDIKSNGDIRQGGRVLQEAGIGHEIGEQGGELLEGADLLVVSPGIGRDSALMEAAQERGVEVVGELEMASWFWPGDVLAITGTNGKTTTAHMIKAILDEAGLSSVLAGNIGYPFSRAVIEHCGAELAVLEVSSFQLEHTGLFHPDVALLLNLAPDHLDRYTDIREYYASKLHLFSNQTTGDWAVCRWKEEELVEPLTSGTGATEMTFGLDGGRLTLSADDVVLDGEKILSLNSFSLPGRHNLENALAAVAAALARAVDSEAIERALGSFTGLAHRLEFVGTYRGITFCNDSKATNLDAMLKALAAFTAPIILIAGGKEKGEDYGSIRDAVASRVETAFLMGESRDAMAESLSGCCEVVLCAGLDEAVAGAAARASGGDHILLSPGCSSLDMYGGFEERGNHFKGIVKNLRGVRDE